MNKIRKEDIVFFIKNEASTEGSRRVYKDVVRKATVVSVGSKYITTSINGTTWDFQKHNAELTLFYNSQEEAQEIIDKKELWNKLSIKISNIHQVPKSISIEDLKLFIEKLGN